MYVALAVTLNCRAVRADQRLFNALKNGPLGAHILWIEDLGRAVPEIVG
jgi:hypothetical protein